MQHNEQKRSTRKRKNEPDEEPPAKRTRSALLAQKQPETTKTLGKRKRALSESDGLNVTTKQKRQKTPRQRRPQRLPPSYLRRKRGMSDKTPKIKKDDDDAVSEVDKSADTNENSEEKREDSEEKPEKVEQTADTGTSATAEKLKEPEQATETEQDNSEDAEAEVDPEVERLRKDEELREELSNAPELSHNLTPERRSVLLQALQSDNEDLAFQALFQLNEFLALSSEESFSGFQTDKFVTALGGLMRFETNSLLQETAARAMINLLEAFPGAANSFVRSGILPTLCTKLLAMDSDLGEMYISILSKVSEQQPLPILRAGSINAAFTVFDFCTVAVQRHAASLAANVCARLPADSFDSIKEEFERWAPLIQHHDKRVQDQMVLCFTRITESFLNDPVKIQNIYCKSVVSNFVHIIALPETAGVSTTTLGNTFRSLALVCRTSPTVLKELLSEGICQILKVTLENLLKETSHSVKSPQYHYDVLALVNELLPSLPSEVASFVSSSAPVLPSHYSGRKLGSSTFGLSQLDSRQGDDTNSDPRLQLFQDDHQKVLLIGDCMLHNLVKMFNSVLNPTVRYKCISAIIKIIQYSKSEDLRALLADLNYSAFIARLLTDKELGMVASALYLAELSMEKLPDIFQEWFMREGVVHQIETVISEISSLSDKPDKPSGLFSYRGSNAPSAPELFGSNNRPPAFGEQPPPGFPFGTPTTKPIGGGFSFDPVAAFGASGASGLVNPPSGTNTSNTTNATTSTNTSTTSSSTSVTTGTESATTSEGAVPPTKSVKFAKEKKGDAKAVEKPEKKEKKERKERKAKEKKARKVREKKVEKESSSESEEKPSEQTKTAEKEAPAPAKPSTPAVPQKSRNEILREWISTHAAAFRDKYFPTGTGATSKSEEFNKLSEISLEIRNLVFANSHNRDDEAVLEKHFREVANLLLLGRISAFEFAHSGCIPNLLQSLVHISSDSSADISRRVKRIRLFSSIFMATHKSTSSSSSTTAHHTSESNISAFGTLVLLIQKLLSAEDLFPVYLHGTSTASGLRTLTDTFKINLVRDPTESKLYEYTHNHVLVEPLATVSDITKFLFERVKRPPPKPEVVPPPPPPPPASSSTKPTASSLRALLKQRKEARKQASEEEGNDAEEKSVEDKPSPSESESWGVEPSTTTEKTDQKDDAKLDVSTSVGVEEPSSEEGTVGTTDDLLSASIDENSEAGDRTGLLVQDIKVNSDEDSNSGDTRKSPDETNVPKAEQKSEQKEDLVLNRNERVALFLNNTCLNPKQTIFKAIQSFGARVDPFRASTGGTLPTSQLWDSTYEIKYKIIERKPLAHHHNEEEEDDEDMESESEEENEKRPNLEWVDLDGMQHTPIHYALSNIPKFTESDGNFDGSNTTTTTNTSSSTVSTSDLLTLLWLLHTINDVPGLATGIEGHDTEVVVPVDKQLFINKKLTTKLVRQLQDQLALCTGALPTWCTELTTACKFLFPFDARLAYFRLRSFGIARALRTLYAPSQEVASTSSDNRLGRIARQKVRIDRTKVLKSALKVMELCTKNKAILEVEYLGEKGHGLGPTKEFYTLVSKELQRASLDLWINAKPPPSENDENDTNAFVFNRGGLFPKPLQTCKNVAEALELFTLLGQFMAKAMLDERLIDMPFSVPFYKVLQGKPLSLLDLKAVKPELGQSIFDFAQLCIQRRHILSDSSLNEEEKKAKINALRYKGGRVEDLDLTFYLADGELKPGGNDVFVDINNLEEYVHLVAQLYLSKGIRMQIAALRRGFNQFFPLSRLKLFTVSELDENLCGTPENLDNWTRQDILENAKFSNGYSGHSKAVGYLVNVLCSFSTDQRRSFLQFLTGSPRLPVGGWKALQPKFTVQLKNLDTPDKFLPSVNTCFLFLKLPDYSSEEILREKLLKAMNDGQTAQFDFD